MFFIKKEQKVEAPKVIKVDIASPLNLNEKDIQYIIRKSIMQHSYSRVNEFLSTRNVLEGRDREFVARATGALTLVGASKTTTDYYTGNIIEVNKSFFMEIVECEGEYKLFVDHNHTRIHCLIEFGVK